MRLVRVVSAGSTITAIVLTLAGGSLASAGPGWSPVTAIPGFTPLPTVPGIALSPRGDGLIAAISPRFGGPGTLRVAVRPPGGGFVAPRALSTPGNSATSFSVKLTRSGEGIAVWDETDAGTGDQSVRMALYRASGAFSAPVVFGAGSNPRVEMSAGGEAVLVWETNVSEGESGDAVAVLAPGAPAPGPSAIIRDTGGYPVSESALAVGSDGTAVLAFRAFDGTVQAVLRSPGGEFGDPHVLSSVQDTVGPPDVAADAHGNATVVWNRQVFVSPERGYEPVALQAATRTPGSEFSPGGDVAAIQGPASDPTVVSDDAGRTTVAWRERAGVRGATRPPDGVFGAPLMLAPEPASGSLLQIPVALASAPDGTTAVALDSDRYPSPDVVLATVRPAGAASFGSLCTVSTDAGGAAVAAGSAEAVTAVWEGGPDEEMASSDHLARGRTHCAAKPVISSVHIRPSTFTAALKGPSVPARGPRVTFAVDRAVTVTWAVQRVAATSGGWRTLPGRFRRPAKAGRSSFHFAGRIGGRTLRPGYYRLRAVPRAVDGTGTPATVTFSIRRR